ncbi:MAG: hypothetical protein KIS78_18565 [Labilithrix sp.]|nr:hypothetical protein [Labilithrix sp.]MCW5834410.1 hypothetical protein [Labilithrix sp.]
MPRPSRFPFSVRGAGRTRTTIATLVAACVCVVAPACVRRPVSLEQPTTKISFDTIVSQPAIEKIDLLVMVDNSASMADKQRILADAVPDLLEGLVRPKCVDKTTREPVGVLSEPTKPDAEMCPSGSEPAFPPITDMHIGVISSSLGGMGSAMCSRADNPRNDDRGHLLARGESGDVAAAGDLHFLAWYPDVEKNRDKVRHPDPPVPKTTDVGALGAAFRDLIVGVGQDGCGLEAQLESVYRFLVQPDPWTSIEKVDGRATYGPASQVDVELLRQRAAFLRPDSLVAVIVLTDEDDSTADPLSFQGSGWRFMEKPVRDRATAACAEDPASEDCTSCLFAPDAPGCSPPKYAESEDQHNVRFHRMKERFGVDPQFPIARYVDALTKPRVPLREHEHDGSGNYAPKAGCTNPLFAARLPTEPNEDLCRLPRGPRSPGLVYFAVIGGVPSTLVPDAPRTAADDPKPIDWTKVLGRDPARWDEAGIDPHMIPSRAPRPGLPPPSARDDADPVHGREWTTDGADLQFACTFDLYERGPGGEAVPIRRACGDAERQRGLCDCDGAKDAPLCAADDRSVQVRGKAYPSRRPLMVVKELDEQGIATSLCPKQLTEPDADDYGYRPAVRAITSRLERSLVGSCLPRALERDDAGSVACLVLAMLPDPGPDSDCERFGLTPPSADLLAQMRERLRDEEGEASTLHPICAVPQVVVPPGETCKDASDDIAFCYAQAPKLTFCANAIAFTKASQKLSFARFTLQCVQQRTASD